MTTPLSSCCKAPVKRADTSNNKFTARNVFICDSCNKACSIDHPPASTGHGVEGKEIEKIQNIKIADFGDIVTLLIQTAKVVNEIIDVINLKS